VVGKVFGGSVRFYLNNGKGFFTDETNTIVGKEHTRDALGIIAHDFNGDGIQDLYICDRYNPMSDRKDLLLIRNK
jgi:hypothetical protein